MTYEVIFSREAEADLERLFDHVVARELNSPTGDMDLPARAINAIRVACEFLALSPFSCRKVGHGALVRELVISFGRSGFVALFEIRAGDRVVIGSVRHQRESDYH